MPTKIEWVKNPDGSKGESWNPVTGCSKVDEGCRKCYAERMSKRLRGRCGYPADDPFRVTLHPDRLRKPLRWKKPRKIFVNSMSDLFHPGVPNSYILRVWAIMGRLPQHQFMILTKREARMRSFMLDLRWDGDYFFLGEAFGATNKSPLPNVWLGVSVHDQKSADERIPILLQTPAAHRFISQEPALGMVDFHLGGSREDIQWRRMNGGSYVRTFIDLIITGGESGPGARPMHPDIPRSTRDQCAAANVPFLFKQWGDKRPSKWADLAGWNQQAKKGGCRLDDVLHDG